MKPNKVLCLIFILVMLLPDVLQAHKVVVFAWVEDNKIYTQSGFGSKRKAKNCAITLTDENGNVLLRGTTDEKGEHAFNVPDNAASDLLVQLDAGAGHKAVWRIPYTELAEKDSAEHQDGIRAGKEKMEKGPSIARVLGGLGIIFLLALAVKWNRNRTESGKKKTGQGSADD